MKIKIKTFDDMIEEYRRGINGGVKLDDGFFAEIMENLLPKDRTIEVEPGTFLKEKTGIFKWKAGDNVPFPWIITPHMIEEIIEE